MILGRFSDFPAFFHKQIPTRHHFSVFLKTHTLYTGIAADVDKRLAVHQSGKGAKYTRGRGPLTVVYREKCDDKSAALRREREVKALSRKEKLALIEGRFT